MDILIRVKHFYLNKNRNKALLPPITVTAFFDSKPIDKSGKLLEYVSRIWIKNTKW